ncbi:MAG: ABC transporter permease [Candidatus Nanopelagicales bacterium]|nr:ABC transporter permease [Candidatus Nanopelagicales bacterium]MCU0294750.1 ABC transporter permease [Candidatus Nanopelagicales bacterium]MCU0296881.1 ABC transporter permease [Candidatus Nanopelagicales bacterium]
MSSVASSPVRRWQGYLHRHGGMRIAGLLALPMSWLVLLYILPLAMLFVTAFWTTDSFTGELVRAFTTENFQRLFTDPAYITVALRTLGVAVAVTLVCLVLAVPISLFMARVASPRWQPLLIALMLTPLWASYLVKVYAWRVIFSPEGGVLESTFGFSPGFGWVAVVVVLTYLWLPYMILPVYVGMQNVPQSLLDASADLGASSAKTFRRVLLPMVFPSLVAGSIFTFSLSLGDYITVQLVGGKAQMLGNVVYQSFSTDLPFAAAVASMTVIIMIGYLTAVRRTGALDNL